MIGHLACRSDLRIATLLVGAISESRPNRLIVGNRSSNQRYECHLGIHRLQSECRINCIIYHIIILLFLYLSVAPRTKSNTRIEISDVTAEPVVAVPTPSAPPALEMLKPL